MRHTFARGRRVLVCFIALLACLLFAQQGALAQHVTVPADRPVRILAIGNSFSRNATALLPKMIAAGGKDWVFKHADISGSTFERHMKSVTAFETDPSNPAGKPYKIAGADDKVVAMSLKELLTLQPWDYVTVQQASIKSFDESSFEPSGLQLVAYVQKYAPQAKLIVHETWAYRADSTEFSSIGGLDQEQMYTRLHRNYADFARKIDAAGVIPTGTAFQNVREDSRWKPTVDTKVDLSPYKNNALPPEDHDLNTGWTWAREGGPWRIVPDRHHATVIGKYLGACVWYEFFIGDVRGNSYRPANLRDEDALLMQDVAHKTVVDGLIPKAASVPVRSLTYPKPATRPATVPANQRTLFSALDVFFNALATRCQGFRVKHPSPQSNPFIAPNSRFFMQLHADSPPIASLPPLGYNARPAFAKGGIFVRPHFGRRALDIGRENPKPHVG